VAGFHIRDEFDTVGGISTADEILACQESLCSVNLGNTGKKVLCSNQIMSQMFSLRPLLLFHSHLPVNLLLTLKLLLSG
jgi:hypothetical protein